MIVISAMGDLIYAGMPKGYGVESMDKSDWIAGVMWWMYGSFQGDSDSMFAAAVILEFYFMFIFSDIL